MDPPPLTTPPSSATSTAAAASINLNYPDSLDSSPRSRPTDTTPSQWLPDDPLPTSKLRLMCSYGGHIVPRPHDKSLCYVGGDTRIVVVDRHSSLNSLCSRLSKTLLNGRPFTLKYQLPSEDLDSLISVATDEDLDNMIEEYDRTAGASPLKPSRLRLFLFFVKPETAASMGSLLDDAKSETWFVDALNGSGFLPRGLSDSAVEDCLLSLNAVRGSDSCNDLEARGNVASGEMKQNVGPDSPVVENNNSSFGSSSSSPSMSNLPPIRVRVGGGDEQKGASIEEQFAQISFAPTGNVQSHLTNVVVSCVENVTGKVLSDDERSDHGGGCATVGFRKPPLPLHPVQMNKGGAIAAGYGLPSPDSVASDTSISSASSLAKQQQQQHYAPPPRENRGGPASPDTRNNPEATDPAPTAQFQPAKDPVTYNLVPTQHLDQHLHQQFLPATGPQCMLHHPHPHPPPHAVPSPVPVSPYYQVYSQPQQQYHHPLDQQYPPVYVMASAPQNPQPYNLADTTTSVVSTGRQNPGSPGIPPVYPAKSASPALPAAQPQPNCSMVQFPPHYGFSHHPTQSMAVAASSGAGQSYGYEYASPLPTASGHEHVFYTQHHAPMPSHYQSMTPAAAMAYSEAAKQIPPDGNAQPQIRTSQPL